MSLNFSADAKQSKKTYPRPEDGAYPVRIVQILDFGLQYETDWKTQEIKTYDDGNPMIKHKVWINFELPDELIEIDGVMKPQWIGKEYTVSAHEKSALAALLKAVDGKGVATDGGRNVKGLLGLPAMLTIGSTSSGKAKVSAVSAVPKGMQVGALTNPETFFDLDSDDVDGFEKIPNWMKTRIKDGIGFEDTRLAKVLGTPQKAKEEVSVGDY